MKFNFTRTVVNEVSVITGFMAINADVIVCVIQESDWICAKRGSIVHVLHLDCGSPGWIGSTTRAAIGGVTVINESFNASYSARLFCSKHVIS